MTFSRMSKAVFAGFCVTTLPKFAKAMDCRKCFLPGGGTLVVAGGTDGFENQGRIGHFGNNPQEYAIGGERIVVNPRTGFFDTPRDETSKTRASSLPVALVDTNHSKELPVAVVNTEDLKKLPQMQQQQLYTQDPQHTQLDVQQPCTQSHQQDAQVHQLYDAQATQAKYLCSMDSQSTHSSACGLQYNSSAPSSACGAAPNDEAISITSSQCPQVLNLYDRIPSKGSVGHRYGICQPCAWFWKPGGCRDGDCNFCHLCPEDELTRLKIEKKKLNKEEVPWTLETKYIYLRQQRAANEIEIEQRANSWPYLPPSIGSDNHQYGICTPCKSFYTKEGCSSGYNCDDCHLCLPGNSTTASGSARDSRNSSDQSVASQRESGQIPNGTKVTIKDLKNWSELNGKTGEIIKYVVEHGRYLVVVIESVETIMVKLENLEVVDTETPEEEKNTVYLKNIRDTWFYRDLFQFLKGCDFLGRVDAVKIPRIFGNPGRRRNKRQAFIVFKTPKDARDFLADRQGMEHNIDWADRQGREGLMLDSQIKSNVEYRPWCREDFDNWHVGDDGQAYTQEEFEIFYGESRGQVKWKECPGITTNTSFGLPCSNIL